MGQCGEKREGEREERQENGYQLIGEVGSRGRGTVEGGRESGAGVI